jgi:RNA polymerase sigma-54 factor
MYMSMEILCLNSLDLEGRIQEEVENNETLDLERPKSEEAPAAEPQPTTETAEKVDKSDSFEERFEQWDQYSREEYGAPSRSLSSYDSEKDEKLEALSNTEGRPISLQEHLESQLHLLDKEEMFRSIGPLSEEELGQVMALAAEIIYNIDNSGYLMYSLEEIREGIDASTDPPDEPRLASKPPMALFEKALKIVQGLDPPGVGGRDDRECLLLQLRRDKQPYPIEEKIILNHFEDLGHNRMPKIAKALGVTLDEVKAAVDNIVCLNPIPGKLFGGEVTRFVKPDVVVDEVDGKYEVRVDSDYLPRLQISPHYRDLYKASRGDPDLKKYLKKKMDSAEWLIAAIRQRQSTLKRIAQEIVDIQSGFLDHGISHMKPLKMIEVAEKVGVHVSTISRAISEKYMQTPRGIFSMKYFFAGGATKSDGSVEARGSVIQRIKDLISSEDKVNPLSDIDIVNKLAESKIKISRRTVTKYREAESIASSRQRRSY